MNRHEVLDEPGLGMLWHHAHEILNGQETREMNLFLLYTCFSILFLAINNH
jgi:hypothetical protein